MVVASSSSIHFSTVIPFASLSRLTSHSSISPSLIHFPTVSSPKGVGWKRRQSGQIIKAEKGEKKFTSSPSWDESLPSGKEIYFDEQELISFLQTYTHSFKWDPNPASSLWEKISVIPEGRRDRLLFLLNGRLIRAVWDVAGVRYHDPELAKLSSSSLLSGEGDDSTIEFWKCRKTGGTMPFAFVRTFKKALFCRKGKVYGRLFGDSLLGLFATTFKPLYFTVTKEVKQIWPAKQPCDLAYDFGDGILDLDDYPESFPKPAAHSWPFSDQAMIFVRHVGPGVMVGQLWQKVKYENPNADKVCNEILMVMDYSSSSQGDDSEMEIVIS